MLARKARESISQTLRPYQRSGCEAARSADLRPILSDGSGVRRHMGQSGYLARVRWRDRPLGPTDAEYNLRRGRADLEWLLRGRRGWIAGPLFVSEFRRRRAQQSGPPRS